MNGNADRAIRRKWILIGISVSVLFVALVLATGRYFLAGRPMRPMDQPTVQRTSVDPRELEGSQPPPLNE